MAGRVIDVDIMWAREQPGHRSEEDNAAAFQVLVAYSDCVGALEVQVFVAGSAGATGWRHRGCSCQLPPAHTTHCLRQVWRQMQSLHKSEREKRDRGRGQSVSARRKLCSGSAYSRCYSSVMLIRREPCWVEIALDASALPSALAAWSKPASVLLNASESFRSVTPHGEYIYVCVCVRVVLENCEWDTKSLIYEVRESVCSNTTVPGKSRWMHLHQCSSADCFTVTQIVLSCLQESLLQ